MQLRSNYNRFKEPRGFIKIIEFLIAILAFSTTAGYHGEFTATSACGGWKNQTITVTVKFKYPFDEKDRKIGACSGNSSLEDNEHLPSSLKSSSEFFVFVGVVSFLYCIVAMVYYVLFEDPAKYGPGATGRVLPSFATVDFVVDILLTLFWFCASVAWAAGLEKLKDKTDADDYCNGQCKVTDKANYAGITISVIFGFLSCFLWGANLWFVFKETMWHREPGTAETAEQPSAEIPRQEVPGEAVN